MINNIIGSGSVVVSGGGGPLPYVNANPNNPLQGMMRVNGSNIEVYDGHGWIVVSAGYPSVSLTGEAESILQWARNKIAEEAKMKELMKKYPALEKAQQNLDLIWNMVKDEAVKETV